MLIYYAKLAKIALTERAEKLLAQLEDDDSLLSDDEYGDTLSVIDDVLGEIAAIETEEVREREEQAAVTRKSLTPAGPERPRFRQIDDKWYQLCVGNVCRRVTDAAILNWLDM